MCHDIDEEIRDFLNIAEILLEAREGRHPEMDKKTAQSYIDSWNNRLIKSMPNYLNSSGEKIFHWGHRSAFWLAIWEFKMYGNTEPIEKAIQAGNQYLLKSEIMKDILLSVIKGEQPSKRRQSLKKRDTDLKGMEIMADLWRLNKNNGLPICGEYKDKKETAVEIVAKKHNLSPETVRRHIWEIRNKDHFK